MVAFIIILALVVVSVAAYLIMSAPNSKSKRAGMEKLHVHYAHRGLWGGDIPENSLPAFAAATGQGFGIELDVQLSADGDIVVFHDYDLKRMCGEDTKISSLRGAELSWRRLGGTEHTLPLLSDVLATIKGRVPILIELKGESQDTALCEALAREMNYYDGKYCVESFNPKLLGWFRKHQPRIARGLLYTDFRNNGTKNKKLNFLLYNMMLNFMARPDFIATDARSLDSFHIRRMKKIHKIPLFVWTIKDNDAYARFNSMGYCCIFDSFVPKKD